MTTENCAICGNDKEWHDTHTPHHPYSPDGEGVGKLNAKQKTPVPIVKGLGGDPALRLALINAGIISYAQLALAEEELRAARDTGKPVFLDHPADPDPGPGTPIDPGSVPADIRVGHGGGA